MFAVFFSLAVIVIIVQDIFFLKTAL